MKTFKEFISEQFIKTSGPLGSNPGGVYQHSETGKKHYIKFPYNSDQAKSEVLSGKLQDLMGIKTLNPELANIEGKEGVSTKWKEGLTPIKLHDVKDMTPEQHHTIGKIFAHSVLTKNWDGVGTGLDYGEGNISSDKKGNLHGIDPGGSFEFRARGGHKPYTSDISEIRSLRDPNVNHESAHVFNTAFTMTPEALHQGIEAVRNIDQGKVYEAFKNSGLHNWEDLHRTFHERRNKFLDHFQSAVDN